MILSSNRVLKSEYVHLDKDNKVRIEVDSLMPDSVKGLSSSDATGEDKSEARVKKAEGTAAVIIRQAEIQAEDVLSRARIAAAQEQTSIRDKAQAEASHVLAESHEKGYNSGMAAATAEGDAIKAEAKQILEDAKAERDRIQKSLEPEMVNLVISITEKLLGDTVKLNPSVIINLIKQGLSSAALSGKVTVYVSAQDYELVVANKDELLTLTDGSVKLEITKDLSLNPMDCVIETPMGDIDCSLDQQFEALRANLTYILNNK